jgi:autotransporter-associated beta strand protein
MLTYDGNGSTGGTVPTDASSPYTVGSTVTVLGNTGGLAKSGGFSFAGWNTATNGSGTSYDAGITFTITAPLTLYAQWTSTTTYIWTQTAGNSQNWTTAANWADNAVPSPISGNTIDFSTVDIAASTTLTLGADRTATTWKFGDTTGAQTWSVASSNKIILAGITPTISVLQNTATLNCPINGSSGLYKAGPGIMALASSSNAWTGGTFIKDGSIALSTGSDRLPTSTVVTLGDTLTKGTLILGSSGTARNQTLGGLSSTGMGGNVVGQGTGSILTLNVSTNSIFAGVLGGTGTNHNKISLVKEGSGTQILSGSNTYTGTTAVNGGTLAVTGSLANTAVTVGNGATLAGSGSIAGSVSIDSGGRQAFVIAEAPAGQSSRTITGTLTLTAGHIIDLTAPAPPVPGTYTLVTANGGITGTVGTVNPGGVSGTVAKVGNSLVLTVTAGSDFNTWKSANGVTGGPNDDDDSDGTINFEEYAFGLNPRSGASANPVSSPLDKATGLFKYTRRKQSLTGLTYTCESSTTLAGAWPSFIPDSATSNNGDPVEEITVDVPDALLADPALFIRVKATE